MRVFFAFLVVVLLAFSSYIVSQDTLEIPCDEGLVQVVKSNDSGVEKFCVTPSMVGSFKRLGWQVTEGDVPLNTVEEATTIGTEDTEEIPEVTEEVVTEEASEVIEEVNEDTEIVGELTTFAIISGESKASYKTQETFFGGAINEIGFTTGAHETVGGTAQMLGQVEINPDDLSLGRSYFGVLISSLQSNLARRDETIRKNDLESSKYPVAEFTAKSIEDLPTNYQKGEEISFLLLGDMTIREVTRPATFNVTATITDDALEGVMVADLLMTDFGFNPPNWSGIFEVQNSFQVEVEFAMSKRDAWDESIASAENIIEKLGLPQELLAAAPEAEGINIRHFALVPENSKASYFTQEEFLPGALEQLGVTVGRHERSGSTENVSGQMIFNPDNLSEPLGPNRFIVQIESLTSDEEERDDRLREEWLESSKFPFATLTATSIENAPKNYSLGEKINFTMQGDLAIREVTQPTAFDVTATVGSDSIVGVMKADLHMTDFGFNPPSWAGVFTVDDEFKVEIEFEMTEIELDLGPPPSE